MGYLLIGSYPAKLDEGGRLKIPERFRTIIEDRFGKELFITSLEDDFVQIFPYPVWERMTETPANGSRYLDPDIQEFLRKAHVFGAAGEIDAKGRALIGLPLREKAGLLAEVQVIGLNDYLEVWDRGRLMDKMAKKPLTHEDFKQITKLWPERKPE